MKAAVLILLLFYTSFVVGFKNDASWNAWKKTHRKKYSNEERELKKYNKFLKKEAEIMEHNKKFKKGEVFYSKGHTEFSDMDPVEIQKLFQKIKAPPVPRAFPHPPAIPQSIPSYVSYKKYCMPPLNQGLCSSCWAFSTAALAETKLMMKYSYFYTHISPQHIMDKCSNCACSTGGSPIDGINIMYNNGMARLTDYPYVGTDQPEYSNVDIMSQFVTTKAKTFYSFGSAVTLMNFLATKGPLVILMWANPNEFPFYHNGVYSDTTSPTNCVNFNHAVLLIGYGVDTTTWPGLEVPYFLAKNSYGEEWGDGGYFKIIRDYPGFYNNGNVACVGFYASVE